MLLVLFFLLVSCSESKELPTPLLVNGRDGKPLYSLLLPPGWRIEAVQNLEDTKEPIAKFTKEGVEVTFHTFEEAPSPPFQVERWKKQLSPIYTETIQVKEVKRSGFVGIQFEGEGRFRGSDTAFLAVSMRLDPTHYQTLKIDYTLKAIGNPKRLFSLKEEILKLFASLQLIDELPERPFR